MARTAALILAVVVCLGACTGRGSASATPGAAGSILPALAARGFVVTSVVGGDAGCPDPGLAGNALHVAGRLPPDTSEHEIYLYVFRSRDYHSSGEAVDGCMRAIAERRPDVTTRRLDIAPYRAVGYWGPEVDAVLRDALNDVAGGSPGRT